MIITDYNEMSINELEVMNKVLNKEFTIENGKITGASDRYEEKN